MSEEAKVARSAGKVGAATMASRVLGLAREQVMATLFGAGLATDAFNVAFRIPNLLRDLFAEGAMSAAFVPTFTAVHEREGERAAWAFGRQLVATLIVVLGVVCSLGWVFAPALVRVLAPGFSAVPGKLELTVLLTRIMLPFLPAVSLAAAAMGMLNARGRFGVPALAPMLMNLGMIVVGVGLIPLMRRLGQPEIVAMAFGVLVGGFLQFAVQLPALYGLGFRLRFERPTLPPPVRRVGALVAPATLGLAATQINLFVSTLVASLLEQGSVSWLWYAFRLMQLPIGVFGVALATVSLPALSRAAVANDLPGLRTTLSATLRLLLLLTIPATLWLAVMSGPIVALLYEHGRFGPRDTDRTALALVMYCVGLPAFAAVGVLTRAFYALGDTRRPVQASFVSVALNLVLNLTLMGPLGHLGLALATSITSVVNLLQLTFYLRRRLGRFEGSRMLATAGRVGAAAAGAAGLCAAGLLALGDRWHGGAIVEGATVLAGAALAVPVGWAIMRALRVEELGAAEEIATSALSRLRGGRR
jgi:putative peptidoglycan lipid II flippase